MAPDSALEKSVRAAAKMLRGAKRMTVTSDAGTGARHRHGRRLDRRRLGLDRQARHAGALAGRHRRELPQERQRQRHAGARPRRHQPHLQALPGGAGAADAGGRLRDAHRGRGRGRRDDARAISPPGATARPTPSRTSASASTARRATRRWRCTTAPTPTAPSCARSPAISCSPPAPTSSPAATPPATSTFPSCARPSPSTAPRSCARAFCRMCSAEQSARDRTARASPAAAG